MSKHHDLEPRLEKFYTAILDYAGLDVKDKKIVSQNEALSGFSIDGKPLALPYMSVLRDPEGVHIFHPLNENYSNPENTAFSLYKRHLTLDLNMRLSAAMTQLLQVASDVLMQQKVKSSKMLEIISNLGDVDMSMVDHLVEVFKRSMKENEEGYIFDVYLKKNGKIGETAYAAIGKVNFPLYKELQRALSEHGGQYKVYGYKVRKKDLLAYIAVIKAVLPAIDNPEEYVVGTDNKVFRYMEALLLATYPVGYRLKEIADLLREVPSAAILPEEIEPNLTWSDQIEEVRSMATEIRFIPDQTNPAVEAKHLKLSKMKEEIAAAIPPRQTPQVPAPYQPTQPQQPMAHPPSYQPPPQQPQQQMQPQMQPHPNQAPSSPEDVIRAQLAGYQQYPAQQPPPGYYPPQNQPQTYPGYPPPQQPPPGYYPPQQQMQPPPGYYPAPPQQPQQPPPPPGWNQMHPQQPQSQYPQQQGYPQTYQGYPPQHHPAHQGGIPMNPHLMGSGSTAPWD